MSDQSMVLGKPRLRVRTQVLATLCAVAGAVALPQIFHLLDLATGTGTAPGEVFLPMHLPILLVGLLAGPYAGAAAGLLGPLVSFSLTGMPNAVMLPFMVLELMGYGLSAGLLRSAKLPVIGKVVAAQVGGRLLRAAAILIAFYGFSYTAVPVASIWKSLLAGLPGLLLQWAFLPLIVYRVEHSDRAANKTTKA